MFALAAILAPAKPRSPAAPSKPGLVSRKKRPAQLIQLWHVDLYRLKRPDDAWELGLEDAFAEAACLIEWPERLENQLPANRLDIALSPEGDGRNAALTAHGAWRTRLATI